jgi:predicted O-methyltransferase YrrM
MKIKQKLKNLLPAFFKRKLEIRRESKKLYLIQKHKCETKNLRLKRDINLDDFLYSSKIEMSWNDSMKKLDAFAIPDGTGGVNPGDRRAIYYIIRKFKPSSVLEIGTHIGASTLNIAEALFMNQIEEKRSANLVSVDIADVNDPTSKPWLEFGAKKSPIEMVSELGFGTFVEFVNDQSLSYLYRAKRMFDFIFLDGDHAAITVYQEIPSALNLLNEKGLILLHDYFPNLKPIWSNESVIPGPFLAVERLRNEGANLNALPLGNLPWPTKFQTNISSLALLLRFNLALDYSL